MRNLDRDRRPVLIARYVGIAPEVDADGLYTGRNVPSYTEPEEFLPTVSAAMGEAQNDIFGQKLEYDRRLTIDDPAFEVKESDRLWVDADPESEHDHVVKRVARTGSYTVIAAKRVEVSE